MRLAVAAALLVCACGAGSPAPCTSCLQVAGLYSETAQNNLIDCGDGTQLRFTGGSGENSVSQQGSKLQFGSLGMTGVLHADGSAQLGPIPAEAQSVTGGPPTPGKLRLLGWFFDDGGGMQFEGSYTFVADTNGCELDAHTAMHR
jgi:hypothetical protein